MIKHIYSKIHQIALSQLGYLPKSKAKDITFIPGYLELGNKNIPEEIPFYIQWVGSRHERTRRIAKNLDIGVFRDPIDISQGEILSPGNNFR